MLFSGIIFKSSNDGCTHIIRQKVRYFQYIVVHLLKLSTYLYTLSILAKSSISLLLRVTPTTPLKAPNHLVTARLDASCDAVSSHIMILRPLHTSGLFTLSGNSKLNASIDIAGISGASSRSLSYSSRDFFTNSTTPVRSFSSRDNSISIFL